MATAALKVGGVLRGSEGFTSRQGTVHPSAICAETVGATGVFLGKVTIPPGGRTGDYWFIPAEAPHVAVNRGTMSAVFIGARKESSVKESQLMRPELDAFVR